MSYLSGLVLRKACLYQYVHMASTYIFKLFRNLCWGEMCETHPCHDWSELYPVSATNRRFRLFASQLLIKSSSRHYSDASQMVCHFLGYRQFCNIRQHIITLQCHQNESVLQIRIFIMSYFLIVRTYEITNTSENGSVYMFNMFHPTGSISHLIEESCKDYKKIFQYHLIILSNIFCLGQHWESNFFRYKSIQIC